MEIPKLTQIHSWNHKEIILMDSEDKQYIAKDVELFESNFEDNRRFPDDLRELKHKWFIDFEDMVEDSSDTLIRAVNKWFKDAPYQFEEHMKLIN